MVIYDNFYTLGSLCFYVAPYYLVEGGNIYVVVFSENVYRNAKKVYEYALKNYPMILKFISRIGVVKIGVKDENSFGGYCKFIHQYCDWIDKLVEVLNQTDGNDIISFFGLSPCTPIYKEKVPEYFLRIYNSIPEGVTVFCPYYKKTYDLYPSDFVDLLHDVVFYIRKNNALF